MFNFIGPKSVNVSVESTSVTSAALFWITSCNSTNPSITFIVNVEGVNDQYFTSNYKTTITTGLQRRYSSIDTQSVILIRILLVLNKLFPLNRI